jgi:hypothetical protein
VSFTIRWRDAALDDLTAAWLDADTAEREAITTASHSIEKEIKLRPYEKGESRPEGERIFFNAPLAVLFRIEEQTQSVIIEQAWVFHTR